MTDQSSNETGTGMYANSDSTTVFLPLQDIVNTTRRDQLLALLDSEISRQNSSSFVHAQLVQQRQYFSEGKVAAAEIIQWSSGALNPAPNQTYVTFLGGIMVRLAISVLCKADVRNSIQPAEVVWSV